MKERYAETIQTWNKIAQLYEDKFMDLELYDATYRKFIELLPIGQMLVYWKLVVVRATLHANSYNLNPNLNAFLATDVSENMIQLSKRNNPTAQHQVLDARKLTFAQSIIRWYRLRIHYSLSLN